MNNFHVTMTNGEHCLWSKKHGMAIKNQNFNPPPICNVFGGAQIYIKSDQSVTHIHYVPIPPQTYFEGGTSWAEKKETEKKERQSPSWPLPSTPRACFIMISCDCFFFHTHREISVLSGELSEQSDQYRFLLAVSFAHLKGSVGLILVKVSSMWMSIWDPSTYPHGPLFSTPPFIRPHPRPPILFSSLGLFPPNSSERYMMCRLWALQTILNTAREKYISAEQLTRQVWIRQILWICILIKVSYR